MQNGKHVIARNLIDGIGFGTTEFHVIRPGDEVIPEWIHFYIRQPSILNEAATHFTGSVGQQRVPAYFLEDLAMPLPSLSEQKRIAATLKDRLADITRARAAAEEQLEAAEALSAAYLREIFESKEVKEWHWPQLKDVCRKIKNTNPRSTPNRQFIYVDISSIDRSVKRIVKPSMILGKDAPSRARRIIHKGDVLVSTTRPNLNAVALVDNELDGQICSTGLCVLRPDSHRIYSDYLYYCTIRGEFVNSLSNLTNGAMYPAVTDGQVLEQTIPLPPLSEQKRIATTLKERMNDIVHACTAIREKLEIINQLPSAILRKAFNGEL